MDISQKILSNIIVYTKYARFIPELKRRETWDEIVDRNMNMHIQKFSQLKEEIESVYNDYVRTKKVLPSMRSLQFAGKPIEISNNRIFNCAYLPMDDYHAFSEIMFLLLGGSGVGYSVQKHHVNRLPEIKLPIKKKRYLIPDSIEGWAESIKMLSKAYFLGDPMPNFDFRDIRQKGALLITSGGKAPGPEPLKDCLHNLKKIFDRKKPGEKLSTLEVHDMCCYIADAVLAGGIRRSAMIAFFNLDDYEMLTAKYNHWYETNPQRGRANNSAVIVRHKINKESFFDLWNKIRLSNTGEPGMFFTNDKNMLANPCVEASLRANTFCNLTEINQATIVDQEDFNNRAKAAAFIGTLQASYTDFHYLREEWKEETEKDALLGVGLTGIASPNFFELDFAQASQFLLFENERVAKLIGINKAARIGLTKPSGTSSIVLGTSSGVHAWHAPYYIRRIRLGKDEAIFKYLKKALPDFIEDDYFKPKTQVILSVPQKAPEGSIFRNESAIDLVERVKRLNKEWIAPTHRKGSNKHNVSCTIDMKIDDWDRIGKWMWDNREFYNGLSVLPDNKHTYIQMPFEEINEKKYNEMFSKLKDIDLSKVKEETDNTDLQGEQACAGGACEII
jgi:ribonucleoside-triphosphate reductase (thioredoxin)